jgi:hypothetical protein
VRPRSITIISWLFIIFGSIALLSGVLPFHDLMSHWYVHFARILMIVAGVFMLKGKNWARWLLVLWITFHIVISALHSMLFLLMHVVIFSVILYFVFRRRSSAYFSTAVTR